MDLPLAPPIEPMLAKLARTLPVGELSYEPKWDGFRCLVFRDGDEVYLQSRSKKPLNRYFPEVLDALRETLPDRVILDGELVIPAGDRLDFDALTNRIHPAESRITLLAEQTPASFVAFDLLAFDDVDASEHPCNDRRQALEQLLGTVSPPVHVSPVTTDPELATDWFHRFEGAGLDGVIAKPLHDPYRPGKRTLRKIKQLRTADVVVGGFRWHKDGNGVGSLLLGLYDDNGDLVHVGVASSFKADARAQLADKLASYELDGADAQTHPWVAATGAESTPRGENRWSGARDTKWVPLRLELVAEVAYEQLQGDRFRHTARLHRWRPDREVESCRFDQLDTPPPAELADLFAVRG